jgi:hypothetical protein
MKGRLARAIAIAVLVSAAVFVPSVQAASTATHSAAPKSATPIVTNGAWTVYHRDDGHTGNDNTLPAATGASTGWVSTALDESVYAEPLVYQGVVYVATLNNTVYALNQSDGSVVWSDHIRAPATGGWTCGNFSSQGIVGTPVIDATSGRIYVVTFASDDLYRVEGLNLVTGVVELSTVVTTNALTGFDWMIQQQRGALALHNGTVYIPFGGRAGDCGAYRGWLFSLNIATAAMGGPYITPGQGAGFWTAGGVVVDDSTGKVFETSGNGTSGGCNANLDGTPVYENDAVVRLSAALAHEDAFIPQDWRNSWCTNDEDLGSASMVLISPTLAFQSGKWGTGFLVNPQALGGMDGQLYPTPKPATYSEVDVCFGSHHDANFGSYAYAAPYVYVSCEHNSRDNIRGGLVALQVDPVAHTFSSCDATCAAPSWHTADITFGPPIVAGAAVWAVDTGGSGLYGFNAATGAQIYHSAGFGVTHFTTPSEAGGQIFVGSGNVVRSFHMTINACTSVTDSAAPPTTATTGTTVTFTAGASGCPSPRYQFWTLAPGSTTWMIGQAYSPTATFAWNTTGLASGAYRYTVWARDAASPGTSCNNLGCFDTFFPASTYSLTSTPCTSVTESAAPPSTAVAGTSVTFTASASGCPNARYQFWTLAPGSTTWMIGQAYSPTATFAWNTAGLAAGTYRYTVWARDAASVGTSCNNLGCFDAFFPATTYALTTTACTSVTESAAPVSTAASGTTVVFTASASGCPSPQYQFWTLAPGSTTWMIGQAYSPTATFNWNTTGLAAGSYRYTVWVRNSSSTGTACNNLGCFDAYFPATAYTLTSTPCASVTESAAPVSTAAAGTTVVFTASASGCPNPLYQFWVLAPGSTTWTIGQAYSPTATFNWNTTGKPTGAYRYTVWVRDASSSGTNSNNLGSFDTYFPATTYTLT